MNSETLRSQLQRIRYAVGLQTAQSLAATLLQQLDAENGPTELQPGERVLVQNRTNDTGVECSTLAQAKDYIKNELDDRYNGYDASDFTVHIVWRSFAVETESSVKLV